MQKWDIWQLDQTEARDNSDPTQPNDPKRPKRFYAILSPNGHLKGGGDVTCLPIKTLANDPVSVEIKKGPSNNLARDSHVYCNEIYTIEQKHFTRKLGHLVQREQLDVNFRLKQYLDL